MKSLQILILLSVVLFSCEPKEKSIQLNNTTQPADVQEVTLLKATENKEALVLTTDALQLVDQITGSSNELPFGMPQNQLIEIINNTFQSKAVSFGINTECGAGSAGVRSCDHARYAGHPLSRDQRKRHEVLFKRVEKRGCGA